MIGSFVVLYIRKSVDTFRADSHRRTYELAGARGSRWRGFHNSERANQLLPDILLLRLPSNLHLL